MKKNGINKKVIVLMLIILLLVLAVGYAAFSDILTISGTANAKGTFDLEFQNAEVVKNIGADADKTTAEISGDKDTLIVNVSDLSYPGAGVEFAVDIVNVGTMPAEVQAVTPNNITGSDKIKVTGLDVVRTDHPKLEAGDRCNIHFVVEWPVDAGEIPEAESSINFGLQIEYIQATGEVFDGKATHTDTDKEGNTIVTNTTTGDDVTEIPDNALIKQITVEDYGKSINYTATVMNNETNVTQEVSNWKVLYNDKSNIYLILDDFLPNNLVPTSATKISVSGTHGVYGNNFRTDFLNDLNTEIYWSEFANGVNGATAIGTADGEILIKSYNEKHDTFLSLSVMGNNYIDKTDILYVPHQEEINGVIGYWLNWTSSHTNLTMWCIEYAGKADGEYFGTNRVGIRPMIKLPSTVTGTIGEEIEIE